MSGADHIKEELGWLKIVFTVCTALSASLIAWLFQNDPTIPTTLAAAASVSATVLLIAIAFVNYRAYRLIEKLKQLENT